MPALELTAVCVDIAEYIEVAVASVVMALAIAVDVATMPAVVPVPFFAMAICMNIS